MAKLKPSQVYASTLVEVVVAMVVILIVFTLATGIFSGVLHSAPNLRRTYINCIADSLLNNTNMNLEQEDLVVEDSLLFIRKINRVEGYSDLFKVTIQINDHGKEAGELSRILKVNVNDK